jgi:hypothetical protein
MILAHSMGNRVCQLFFHWAETKKGRAWLDTHVAGYIACGAPFGGAPKTVRFVVDLV